MRKSLLPLLLSFTAYAMEQDRGLVALPVQQELVRAVETSPIAEMNPGKAEKIDLTYQQKKFLEEVLLHGFFDKPKEITRGQWLTLGLGTSVCASLALYLLLTGRLPFNSSGFSALDILCIAIPSGIGLSVGIAFPIKYRYESNRELQYRNECIQKGVDCLGAKAIVIKSLIEKVMSQDLEEHQKSESCKPCSIITEEMLRSSSQERQAAFKEQMKQCKNCKMSYFQRELELREPSYVACYDDGAKFLTDVLVGICKKIDH